ncbi:MAG TPA: PilZ domain-containing protein [Desulfomonilaceae bacterium]|nr:PilZ domain-containing protein [Desulfomonilaceae bacterium]
MTEKRTIKVRELIRDLRSGFTASQLMNKYKLSTKNMRLLFRKLLEVNAVNKTELDEWSSLYQCSIQASIRRIRRRRIKFLLRIFEAGNPLEYGFVRDLSENGLCIEGIDAGVGDVKTFIIRPPGSINSGLPLVLEATCQWVTTQEMGRKKKILAGFEITHISGPASEELQELLGRS